MKPLILPAASALFLALAACGSGGDEVAEGGLAGGSPVDSSGAAEVDITVECGADLGLTPASGVIVDWMDFERTWAATARGDTLTLTRRRSCGDECSIREEIVLVGLAAECPELAGARSVKRELMGAAGPTEDETPATRGTLQIQDWDPAAGVFSGVLDAEIGFTFHAAVER